jgi:asparagine synthase (glutamine-hydrolysing)
MPGIVGLITKLPRARAEAQLLRMVESMLHESFYETGTWIDEARGVYVGWVARTGSFSVAMPLFNEQKNVCLVFSGEEYPDPNIKAQLKERGHALTSTEANYLVHLYEEENDFPASLNGRFQGLVVDSRRDQIKLFNDRYGLHRTYFHEGSDAFYFSAEAKAILAVRPELRTPDAKSLGEFISCGCVLENRTLFQGIEILPPGSTWEFANGGLKAKQTYFKAADWENQERLDPEGYYGELRDVFSRILPRYFQGRQPVGVSLTGGLDTRMIMAWHKSAPGTMPCYSFGGPFRDCQDVILARRIAKLCGQPHEVIPMGDDFFSQFDRYAERAVYMTDGCVTVSRSCDLYVNERAAKIAPVRMTGNYGSEVLRRLRAFKPVDPLPGLFSGDIESQIATARQTYGRLLQTEAVSFVAFRQLPWHHFGNLALEETQITMRSPFVDNDIVRTAFRAPESGVVKSDIFQDSDDCIRLIRDGDVKLRDIPTDRGLNGGSFASRAYLEFTFKAEYAYDYGMPQWLAKIDHVFSPLHLERLFLGRHKFAHFRVWYRDQLAPYVRDMLLDSKSLSRPYVNRTYVENIVNGHTSGTRNCTSEIHKLLSLELIHRLLIDAGPVNAARMGAARSA